MATVNNVILEEEIITADHENDDGKKTPELINKENQNDEKDMKPPRLKLCCGCCFNRKKDTADPVKDRTVSKSENDHMSSCANNLKLFLDSPVYFSFVIVSTIITSYFLFAELIFDVTVNSASNNGTLKGIIATYESASPVLHWFCFAVLVIYFVEFCFRVGLWRLHLLRDLISIMDCIVIFCSFVIFQTYTWKDSPGSPLDAFYPFCYEGKTTDVKRECARNMVAADMQIRQLEKQITDKNFEIRQLQLFLGDTSQSNDPQIREVLEASKARREIGAAADYELELAMTISKEIYENQTYNNQGYFEGKQGNKLSKSDHDDILVLVHPRPQPHGSLTSDLGMPTDYDEYGLIPRSLRDCEDISGNITGAISKQYGMRNCGPLNSNNNKDPKHWPLSLDLTSIKSTSADGKLSPVSIYIDSEILVCEDKKLSDTGDVCNPSPSAKTDTENNHKSDTGSDGYVTDMSCSPKAFNYEMQSLSRPKSVLLSESGYQSEEPQQNGSLTKKSKDHGIRNDQISNRLIEMECL